jgi:cytochrome c553
MRRVATGVAFVVAAMGQAVGLAEWVPGRVAPAGVAIPAGKAAVLLFGPETPSPLPRNDEFAVVPVESRERAIVLVDRSGKVRRVARGAGADGLESEWKRWRDGRASYEANCARCHGEDGRDESYPGAKSLGGIGTRHTVAEILEKTDRSGFVDLNYLRTEGKKALAIYVAGL